MDQNSNNDNNTMLPLDSSTLPMYFLDAFQIIVLTLPSPNPIPNTGFVTYNYTVDPSIVNGGSGAAYSNTATTQINQASIDYQSNQGMTKSVNIAYAKVGDVLTYTIAMKNTGNMTATSVVLTDTIPPGTAFVTNSVSLNGVTQTGVSPQPPTGVTVGTIAAGATSTVTFQVTVSTIPTINPILNNGTVNFYYLVNPASSPVSNSGNSNTASTQVNQAIIDNGNGGGLVKSLDNPYAKVGDTINYTIRLQNTGNMTATSIVLIDTIPSGTTFVTNSVKLNGTTLSGTNPQTGVSVGTIAAGSVSTVTFQVTVNTIPTINPVPNNSSVTFNYIVNPASSPASGGGNSNTVNTQVNQAIIDNGNGGGLVKSLNNPYAQIGDTITYTIRLQNTGNMTATSVVLTDTIPTGTTFVTNSVTLNGTTQPGVSPQTGVNVGAISPSGVSTVIFQVTVNTIPTVNPTPNNSTVNFQYLVYPLSSPVNASGNSNTVNTQVNQAIIDYGNGGGLVKSLDNPYAKVGDTINYTIRLQNTGSMTATSIVLTDTIPNGTTFVTNSVKLNGTTLSGTNPQTGVSVGTLAAGAVSTVTFQVTVNTIPTINPTPNNATVNFSYLVYPLSSPVSGSGNSNTVNTQVNQAIIDNGNGGGLVKSLDNPYAKVGDTINYTIKVQNTGNMTATSIVLTDTIPTGTTFVTNSVKLNGTTLSGINPQTGVSVGTLAAGSVSTVTFQVTVNTIPTINPTPNNSTVNFNYLVYPASSPVSGSGNSNTVNTQVNQAIIDNNLGGGMVKYTDAPYAKLQDTITYTVRLRNTGNVTATSVVFTDTIPSGTTFVTNSVELNGTAQPGVNPQTGVNVGSIGPSGVSTVVFQVTVNTIPSPNPIPNNSTVNYQFLVYPASAPRTGSGNSNTVNTQVNDAIIDNTVGGGFTKSVNTAYAKVGDILTYTIGLRNTGSTTALSVVLRDTIPSGTSFVGNSVTLNGSQLIGADPSVGIALSNINVNQQLTLTFDIKVDTIPSPNPVPNNATVDYQFIVYPASAPVAGGGNSNTVNTQINQAIIDNTVGGGMVKSANKYYAKIGDTVIYTVRLQNTGNITATSVVFRDTIPTGTTFVNNSVKLNGITQPGVNPQTGVNVPNLGVLNVATVAFSVVVNTIPAINPTPNDSTVNFSYIVNPASSPVSGGGNSNQISTQVNQAIIDYGYGQSMVKYVNQSFAKVFDTLIYTISMKNIGSTTALNVVFTDTTPSATTFVANSVTIDGVSIPGVNPTSGVTIPSIAPGVVSTLTFESLIDSIPVINPIPNSGTLNFQFVVDPSLPNQSGSGNTNIVTTKINQAQIEDVNTIKLVDKAYAKIGDILNYSVSLKNTGNITADNIMFTDTIPIGTTFVNNSVYVNGVNQIGSSPVPPGVPMGSLGSNMASTVTFQVTVNTIPTLNPTPNAGAVNYNFSVNPLSTPVSGDSHTNIVYTQVNQAIIDNGFGGGMVKSVNNAYAKIGDILTYSLRLNNTGNITANNIILLDTIPNGTTFVTNSVYVNGINQSGVSPNPPGFTVGNIGAGQTTTVTYQVIVNTIPSPNPVPNDSSISFNYNVNPAGGATSGSGSSNAVSTQVNQAIIDNTFGGGFVKSASTSYAQRTDIITYTIKLQNTGNVTASSVVLSDTIPNGTIFVPNTVTIDGVIQPGVNPQTGVNVGTISPAGVSTVTFQVTVTTVPTINPTPNAATVNYQYTVNPASSPVSGGGNSNIVSTTISEAIIDSSSMIKSVDQPYAKMGDILDYSVSMKNIGSITATSIVFTDTIPNGTTFVTNSVYINGVLQSGVNPQTGVTIPNIGTGKTSTVTFQVVVNTIPTMNPIPNDSTVRYQYIVNPASSPSSKGENSNTVTTQINQAVIDDNNVTKSVDLSVAKVSDILTYTIGIRNTGNVTANNVMFTDTIPSGTTFVVNSVNIDSVPQTSVAPNSGVLVGSIAPGGVSTVSFEVTVVTIPTINPIPNDSTVRYQYTVNPAFIQQSASANSNTVLTQISQAEIDFNGGGGFTKTANPIYAQVGDTVTYTMGLRNTGNVTALNISMTDTIPSGTTFVPNSVIVNGTPQPGVDPQIGINVGSVGQNQTSTVSFDVVVATLPTINPIPNYATVVFQYLVEEPISTFSTLSFIALATIVTVTVAGTGNSNTANVVVNQAIVSGSNVVKSVDKLYAKTSDTLNYTIAINNTGNTQAQNVVLIDTVPNGTTFVPNSVTVNGYPLIGSSPNPPSGINVGTISAGFISTVTFQVVVNTIPTVNPIPNSASVTYNYLVNPASPPYSAGSSSNIATTQINEAIISGSNGSFTKSVSPQYATLTDELTYTIKVTNSGNVTASNVIVYDTIPQGTMFTPGSVIVNGASTAEDPATGITITSIPSLSTSTITFKVTVVTLPTSNPIVNTAYVGYNYTIDPSSPNTAIGTSTSSPVNTSISLADLLGTRNFTKSVNKEYAKLGDTVTYIILARNIGNVSATNIIVYDTIPQGATYVPGSLRINGTGGAGNPATGILVPPIGAGASSIITFNVYVDSVPAINPMENNATLNYSYTVDPSNPNSITLGNVSNNVYTTVNGADIQAPGNFVKSTSTPQTTVGGTIVYSFFVQNTGNVTAYNIILYNTIPNGTSFVPGSVIVGPTPSGDNPVSGINIPQLPPGSGTTVTFNLTVDTIPNPNPIVSNGLLVYNYQVSPGIEGTVAASVSSNSVYTAVIPNLNFTKYPDVDYAIPGDTVVYTVVVQNPNSVPIIDAIVNDLVAPQLYFIPGSVVVNGVNLPEENILTGVNVAPLNSNQTTTLQFTAKVVANTLDTIPNIANLRYFIESSSNRPLTSDTYSNLTTVNIRALNVSIQKTAPMTITIIGSTIPYTVVLQNSGDMDLNNVQFIDLLPSQVSLLTNTFMVNGNTVDVSTTTLRTGVNIGTMPVGSMTTVTFETKVINTCQNIVNRAYCAYSYTLPNGTAGNGVTSVSTNTISNTIIC